ncbi:hypothetical protein BMT55_03390 [Listeria newyorkensis]|uniref:Uncharacterized protein n=1 Tax=Listeria newyorkensis TaxID=1497681 RepID=A0ABX4XP57_9LIST|nr:MULTISPECIES: hypothetical protein [Listeria]KGL41322.1 hypothetical protein EP56_12125 [Listeriaceae bacterium FSL A5-0209]KGL44658.1 hypothetical protein EP58_04055 [Listeria newyorkensis]PNP93825.1 hypothetical protein BMT55_03390 [Listeria newyorkensis]RQW67329.1 hypothetical protein DUK53_06105 [Listeria sp. SHR_NRA_18]WAO22447.1 hypothetical protein OTR81_04015 [Listeria newyorkensis]
MRKLLRAKVKDLYFTFAQRKKKMSNGIELTYLHQGRHSSKQLIVVFSSLTKERKYTFNYIRTLKNVPCQRLFILDNFGLDKRGVFYLGENGNMEVRDAVEELIRQIIRKNKIKNTAFSGSSKGAFAALYLGIRMGVQNIIVGSPIVHIRTFLEGIANEKSLFRVMSQSQNKLDMYDKLLINTIANYDYKGKVYLQYSLNEEIYKLHIQGLITQLKQHDYELVLDKQAYPMHEDARLFFPDFLKEKTEICINGGGLHDS